MSQSPPAPPNPASATPAELQVGEVAGGAYRLERIVGRGGMGTVFLAVDERLGRQVAVKVLAAPEGADDHVQRFEREARILAGMDHPHIVAIHAVGRHRGLPFIAMRFLEGDSLRALQKARGGAFTLREAVAIIRPLASALGYMHARGVLHRDLKPTNVMVGPDGHVTLFDLGIARPQDSKLTRTGVVFGTPGYLAPELILGDEAKGGQADQYALGVILFELLTGFPPFPERDEQLLRAHVFNARPDPVALRPALPAALGPVVQKAMAVRPEDRFGSMTELVAALEQACGPEGFAPLPPSFAPTAVQAPPRGAAPAHPAAAAAPTAQMAAETEDRTRLEMSTAVNVPPLAPRPATGGRTEVDPSLAAKVAALAPRPAGPSSSAHEPTALTGPAPAATAPGGPEDPTTRAMRPVTGTAPPARAQTPSTQKVPVVPAPLDGARHDAGKPAGERMTGAGLALTVPAPATERPRRTTSSPSIPRTRSSPGNALAPELPPAPTAQAGAARTGPAVVPVVPPPELPPEPKTQAPPLGPAARRRRALTAAGAAALLLLLVAAAFWLDTETAHRPTDPRPVTRVVGIDAPPPPAPEPQAPEATPDVLKRIEDVTARSEQALTARLAGPRVSPGVRRKSLQYEGERGEGELNVRVMMNGVDTMADIFLGERHLGDAPVTVPVRAGTYRLVIRRRPFADITVPVQVTQARAVRLEVELAPLAGPDG